MADGLHLHFSFAVAMLLLTGMGLGSALPSTPGYVGIYQFVAVTVLTPFGFSRDSALAYILVAQASAYVVTLALACPACIGSRRRLQLHHRALLKKSGSNSSPIPGPVGTGITPFLISKLGEYQDSLRAGARHTYSM